MDTNLREGAEKLRHQARQVRQESALKRVEAERRRRKAEARLKALLAQWYQAERRFFHSLETFDRLAHQRDGGMHEGLCPVHAA